MRAFSSKTPDGQEQQANPLEGLSFGLDDETFACEGEVDFLDTSELAALAMAGGDTRDPSSMALISQFLRMALGPMQYQRLRVHMRAHRTPADVVLEIVALINERMETFVAGETERPTVPPSSSSDGRQAKDERTARIMSLAGGDVRIVDEADLPSAAAQ